LILFLVKKDESPYVREHARQSLNFELTLFPIFFIGSIFTLTGVGLLILLAAAIVDVIFHVNGAIAANRGQGYRIPLAISMIKCLVRRPDRRLPGLVSVPVSEHGRTTPRTWAGRPTPRSRCRTEGSS